MSETKRNGPCPCGSGKKYKQCCGRASSQTPGGLYDRLRRLDGEASEGIKRITVQRYGKEGFLSAMAEFLQNETGRIADDDPDFDLFTRWFFYDWLPADGDQPAEAFLLRKDPRTDPDILRLVDRTIDAPFSFLQVTAVRPGESFDARDILRARDFLIIERSASQGIQPGHIIYARVVDWDGTCIMMGTGGHIIPASFMGEIMDLREELLDEEKASAGMVSDDTLLTFEEDMRLTYFDLVEASTRPIRDIRNTDGDPMLFHTIRYEVPSFERAFGALRGLEPDATDAELVRADGKPGPAGETAVIHWSKRRKGSPPDETIVQGVIRIRGKEIAAEVNSAKRAARVRKEIEKRLGGDAVYLGTEIASPEGAMKKTSQASGGEDAAKRAAEQAQLMALPEVQAHLKKMMDKHWASWPDTPVPALRGMTPRAAAKDPAGRELLESLLLDFESKNRHARGGFEPVDVAKLRRELGMERR